MYRENESNEMVTAGGQSLIPYGSLMIAIGRLSIDEVRTQFGTFGGGSDTEVDVNFRGGLSVPLEAGITLNGELNLTSRDNAIYLTIGAGVPLGG